jgi:hypothetical protein
MGRKIRTISRIVPAKIKDEAPSDPPYFNVTASWYSGDAWLLFDEIAQRCGLPTAKFIFQKCIEVADEQESRAKAIKKAKAIRGKRAPIELPTLKQVDSFDRNQTCRWWDRLGSTDQKFKGGERKIIGRLAARYVEFGGYPKGYIEGKLPPIKQKGARRRNMPKAAELPAMFEALKMKHPKLSNARIAETIVDQHGAIYGKSPANRELWL